MAQTAPNAVMVQTKDGGIMEFLLSSEPHITCHDNEVIIATAKTTLTLPVVDVEAVYLGAKSAPTGLVFGQGTTVAVLGESIKLNGIKTGTYVGLYTPDGLLLVSATATNDGQVSLPMTELPKGVVILKINRQCIKVLLK